MAESRSALPGPKNAMALLDMYFLDMRCHLLETAAALDRIDRAGDAETARRDPRMEKMRAALDILKGDAPDRAERFLRLFSV